MKPLTSNHAYTSVVQSTKTFLLLLSGGIVLLILILLMQLFSYVSKASSNNSMPEPEHTVALSPVHLNESDKNDDILTKTRVRTMSHMIHTTNKTVSLHLSMKRSDLSESEKTFIDENEVKNTEIVKELADVVEMHDFHFKYGASRLEHPAAIGKLDSSIQKCIAVPESWSKIIILGFTDTRGNKFSNIKLGMKRAEMLKAILVKKGIPAEKIVVASFGSELPIGSNKNESGRSLNRRVEFNLVAAGG